MKEPPQAHARSQYHQPNRLIPPERITLRLAPLVLGHLLLMLLNSRLNHQNH
jgi:hypothetical protein